MYLAPNVHRIFSKKKEVQTASNAQKVAQPHQLQRRKMLVDVTLESSMTKLEQGYLSDFLLCDTKSLRKRLRLFKSLRLFPPMSPGFLCLRCSFVVRLRTCGCPKDYALLDEGCVKCGKLHLNCSKPGSEVHSALPMPGFTRLEFGIKAEN